MKDLYAFKFWYMFITVVLLYLIITYIMNSYVYTDSFYHQVLSDKFDYDRVTEIIHNKIKYQYIGYIILPILILLKLSIIAGVIYIGLFLFDSNIKYKNCLNIVLVAELVSIIVSLIRTGWFIIFQPKNTTDIQYFSPLSLAQFLNVEKLPKYLFYPLQLINVFEVAYWLVLVYGIMAFTDWKFGKSLKTVASSYGVALAVWVVVVIFLQVQYGQS